MRRVFFSFAFDSAHVRRLTQALVLCILGDPGAASRDDAYFQVSDEINFSRQKYRSLENIASSRLAAPGSPRMTNTDNTDNYLFWASVEYFPKRKKVVASWRSAHRYELLKLLFFFSQTECFPISNSKRQLMLDLLCMSDTQHTDIGGNFLMLI